MKYIYVRQIAGNNRKCKHFCKKKKKKEKKKENTALNMNFSPQRPILMQEKVWIPITAPISGGSMDAQKISLMQSKKKINKKHYPF